MSDPVYLVSEDDNLVPMRETLYEYEADLQELLENHPELLLSNADDAPALLLVKKEVGVPGDENEGDNFSLDHLFLDAEGTPTLVEVKRSTDTRIRREVIGQMLDYAANAVAYWSIDRLRGMYAATWEQRGADPDEVLATFLGSTIDHDTFWDQVKTNLQAGKVRLIFAADTIPNRLRRVVEFLNEQMDPAEVLAIEVRQFTGDGGVRMVAPRVIGQSAKAEQRKGAPNKRKWNETEFMAELGQQHPTLVPVAKKILTWANDQRLYIWWGEGKHSGSFFPLFSTPSRNYQVFAAWTNGKIEIEYKFLKNYPAFADEETLREFLSMLNAIPGVQMPEAGLPPLPRIPLNTLVDEANYRQFIKAVEWAYQKIRQQ